MKTAEVKDQAQGLLSQSLPQEGAAPARQGLKVLSLSDIQLGFIYSPQIVRRFPNVDLVIGCGDLPYYYLEYVMSLLNTPLFYVRGNHASQVEYTVAGPRTAPMGAVDLHRRVISYRGLLLAGIEGSVRYRPAPYQYSQTEMWLYVLSLVPALMLNKARCGRYLDVLVTHAPPWGIHDQRDLPHQGIKAFRWLLDVFRPSYHFHGHIHVYQPSTVIKTLYKDTLVLNTYGFRETFISQPHTAHEGSDTTHEGSDTAHYGSG